MLQASFERLRRTESELQKVQEELDRRILDPECTGSELYLTMRARAESERTYILRLLAEFEGEITESAPRLQRTPMTFGIRDGLGFKLDQLGAALNLAPSLRNRMDDEIRDHRNELAHGRTYVPRVSFEDSHFLIKRYLRELW
jgi:hypothetical protein